MTPDGDATFSATGAIDEQTLAQVESLREEAKQAPTISAPLSVEEFSAEFEATSIFAKKLRNLKHTKIRKCRRDGNCFYRSYLFGMFVGMASDLELRKNIRKKITDSLQFCEEAGYDRFAIEEMHEVFLEILQEIFPEEQDELSSQQQGEGDQDKNRANIVPESKIQELFQTDDFNYPICYVRCLTSSYMKHNRTEFEPFLGEMYPTVDQFCMSEVDPLWREADQLQIQALSQFFRIPIRIYYLDQSEGETCTVHDMEFEEMKSHKPIDFLYRPGHYELLYH